jgi:hypothetical protein
MNIQPDSDYEEDQVYELVRTYKAFCKYCKKVTSCSNPDRTGAVCPMCMVKQNASYILLKYMKRRYNKLIIKKRYSTIISLKTFFPEEIIKNIVILVGRLSF